MIAPAKCYLDHIEAWSVNECTINWNAPLAWLTGFLTGYSEDGILIGSTGNGSGVKLAPESKYRESNVTPAEQEEPMETGTSAGKTETTATEVKRDSSDSEDDGGTRATAKNSGDEEDAGKTEKSRETNWPLIIGLIMGFVLLLTGMILFFIYRMTKLKMNNRGNDQNDQK